MNPVQEDKSSAIASRTVVTIVVSRAARKTAMARANMMTAILALPHSSEGSFSLAISDWVGAESDILFGSDTTVEVELVL